MKRIVLLLLLSINICFGQDLLQRKLSLSFKNESLENCLRKIAQTAGIDFSYNSQLLKGTKKEITHVFNNETLEGILTLFCKNTYLDFKEIGGQISIYKSKSKKEMVTISGYVRMADSKEEIIGARIYFKDIGTGCISNSYGYYASTVPRGETTSVLVKSIGLQPKYFTINTENEMALNIYLEEDTLVLGTVNVVSKEDYMSSLKLDDLNSLEGTVLSQGKLKNIPPSSGEYDIAKYAQTFPGIQPSVGGLANFISRGLGPGNNLLLIDEIPIYHPTHLLGFSSIINADALKSAKLFKDYIPANYGFRNSSVLQIRTQEGDQERFRLNGGVSLLSLRANVQGPIKKNISSFHVSFRNSLFPRTIRGFNFINSEVDNPRFFDLNVKLNYKLNANNRIYLTGYFGNDKSRDNFLSTFRDKEFNWGNRALSTRWNHIFNARNFANLSVVLSSFELHFLDRKNQQNSFRQGYVSPKIKYEITTYLNKQSTLVYGFESLINKTVNRFTGFADIAPLLDRTLINNDFFFIYKKTLRPNLKFEAGIRIPSSFHIGRQDTATFLNKDLSHSNVIYEKGKLYDFRINLDPRAIITYRPNATNKLSAAVSLNTQQMHLINYNGFPVPFQVWTNSSSFLPPQKNYQLSLEYSKKFKEVAISTSIFGRYVNNVPDYVQMPFVATQTFEKNLLSGYIFSTGAEIMIRYTSKKNSYSSSFSYSYLYSRQNTPLVNGNNSYPTLYSRPHYFNFNQSFALSKKWTIGSNLILHSETALTYPNGEVTINGFTYPIYSEARNDQRLPRYSRLDLSFTRKLGLKKKRDIFWLVIAVQNVFFKYNPSSFYVVNSSENENKPILVGPDFTPFLITLTLNFKL